MKASVFIAASLDGFIARADGDIDWLGGTEEGADHGYETFMKTVDILVMGRNTFEKVLSFGGAWPYEKPVAVLTHRSLEIPDKLTSRVEVMSGTPTDIVAQLAKRGAQHLYVDGGKTIQAFLFAGIVQRLIITRIPILLGDGIPLFGPLVSDIQLRHIATHTFDGGLVQSEYEVTS